MRVKGRHRIISEHFIRYLCDDILNKKRHHQSEQNVRIKREETNSSKLYSICGRIFSFFSFHECSVDIYPKLFYCLFFFNFCTSVAYKNSMLFIWISFNMNNRRNVITVIIHIRTYKFNWCGVTAIEWQKSAILIQCLRHTKRQSQKCGWWKIMVDCTVP